MVGISLWQIWNFDTFSRRRRGWALAESRPVRSHAETAKWPRKVGSALPPKTCHFKCPFDFLIVQGRKGVGGRVRPWTWPSFWVPMAGQPTKHLEQQELWRWVVWWPLLVYWLGYWVTGVFGRLYGLAWDDSLINCDLVLSGWDWVELGGSDGGGGGHVWTWPTHSKGFSSNSLLKHLIHFNQREL